MADLIPYSWYKDSQNRTWLLIAAPIEPYYNEQNHLMFKPTGEVILLELGKNETIRRPYEEIEKYITNGTFKPLNTQQ